jgi:hypothetical protein
MTLKAKESEFFNYNIQTKLLDLEHSFLLLECSPQSGAQLYVSSLHLYPYELEHHWAFGELPVEVV